MPRAYTHLHERPSDDPIMNSMQFLKEGIRNIRTVGTLTRSSKFLCRNVVRHVDFARAKVIVELGAGDGVITRHILQHMAPDARLLAFEVLPSLAAVLRTIDDARLIVINDSAEYLGKYLERYRLDGIDAVVSAIPFVALPDELAYRIVGECKKYMKPGAPYIQVHYSLLAKKIYEDIFGKVKVHFVPLNVPPAFVLVAEKTAQAVEVAADL